MSKNLREERMGETSISNEGYKLLRIEDYDVTHDLLPFVINIKQKFTQIITLLN